ncbi:MAG: hypothetical protein V3R57_01000 [Candidatus Bathyarchaeia archaeon]
MLTLILCLGFESYTAVELWSRSASNDFDICRHCLAFITSMALSMNRGTPEFTLYRLM